MPETTAHAAGPNGAEYDVRMFRESDRAGYLSLYETVFGEPADESWFDWKYVENPYARFVPIVVAEHEGRIVGARSFLPLALQAAEAEVLALQACDTMVHPDHRRRGLFTRMTETAIERYTVGTPRLSFNFPNEKTLAGNLKLGWELVEYVPVYYRYTDPGRFLDVPAPVGRLLSVLARGYAAFRARVGRTGAGDVTVTTHRGVPSSLLADLARTAPAPGFHVPRDDRFYGWRYSRPDRSYTTYVAHRSGRPVGAAVVGTGGGTEARIMEIIPRDDRPAAVTAALLRAVCRGHADEPLVTTLADDVDPSALAAFGFLPGNRPPLDRLVGRRAFVVRPFTGTDGWSLDGVDLRDPGAWLLGFGELDVG